MISKSKKKKDVELPSISPPFRDHSFSTNAKFSEKLVFLSPCYAHVCWYQGVRNGRNGKI